jgi:amidohydrolase
VAAELDLTVTLIGTPAEERGGGKAELIDRGGFAGVHAALMAHPAPPAFDLVAPRTLAVAQFEVSYAGRGAHASVAPHMGVNAADAMTVAQVSLGLLRQQLMPGDQVHGVLTAAGGAANIIPDRVTAEYFCRAPSLESLDVLQPRVDACFQAGAMATGCACEINPVSKPYAELSCDAELTSLYRANGTALRRRFEDPELPPLGSTDMGNVSRVIPSIHPYFGLDCLPDMPHQAGFAKHVNTPRALDTMLIIAKALAWTAIDAATTDDVRDRLTAPHEAHDAEPVRHPVQKERA